MGVCKRSSNMMDSPKKLSNGSMHFSYNLQEGRSPKNLSNSITPEASKNLNYRADKQNYITDEQLKYHRCPTCAEVFPYKSFLSIHLAKGHKRYSKYSKRSI